MSPPRQGEGGEQSETIFADFVLRCFLSMSVCLAGACRPGARLVYIHPTGKSRGPQSPPPLRHVVLIEVLLYEGFISVR